jgi:glucose-1-phosphate thymidylyltransferase
LASRLRPSARGELEITDLNRAYLERGQLAVECFGGEFVWLDTGTHESLAHATETVRRIEQQENLKIGCIEEIALRMGFIGVDQLAILADRSPNTYGDHLRQVMERHTGASGLRKAA